MRVGGQYPDVVTDEQQRADGRSARWERHKQERRALILDAAVSEIEAAAPGEGFHVHQIAARAGLNRPVIYRHFEDRADLDRAVRGRVLGMLRAELGPHFTLDGTIDEVILGLVTAYVQWAADHPALHAFATRDDTGGSKELQVAVQEIADQVTLLVTLGAQLVGVRMTDDEAATVDPLMHGVVHLALGAVRVWLDRSEREPGAEVFARLLTDTIWYAIEGHARVRGVELDPTVPIEELFGSPVDDQSP